MPGFKLTITLVAAAAYAVGKYFFGNKDDDDDLPPPLEHDPYYSSSSYNSRTWNQTQQAYRPPPQSYRPPPPPSYSYLTPSTNTHSKTTTRTPAPPDHGHDVYRPSVAFVRTPSTNAHSKTTTRAPAPPDYGHDVYHPSVASARTPRQTQLPDRTQTLRPFSSFFNHVRESPEHEYSHTCSHLSHISTAPAVVLSDLRSDEPVSVEDLDSAKKLREKARRKGREMSEARSRAKSAQKKGYRGAANTHRQEAMVYESAMKELDKRAAEIIFRENNKNRKEGGKIDLHGLYVVEAVQIAKDQVQTARSRGDEVVRFIVGQGKHAEDGVAKIRPALEDHFTKRGLDHALDPNNPGVLIVRLV